MRSPAQKRAVVRYRQRLRNRGIGRYEVIGLAKDKELIRALASRLAQDDAAAARLRSQVRNGAAADSARKGGILEWLRRSPLVGAGIDVKREKTRGRDLDL